MKEKESPSQKRENALSQMLQRLGASQTQDERYNNGFAHFSLATHSSFARAFEERMASFVKEINVTIKDIQIIASEKELKRNPTDLFGKTVMIEKSIFENTMTMTKWIENFYQESPSINKIAREDQKEIGVAAFAQPPMMGFTPFGTQEGKLDAS